MGSSTSKDQELGEFKMMDSESLVSEVNIPERAENRSLTDKYFIIVYSVCFAVLVPFLIYTLCNSHVESSQISYHEFNPPSFRNFPDIDSGSMNDELSSSNQVLWRSHPGEYVSEHVTWKVILACFISFGIAFGMLLVLRKATACLVWSILIIFILGTTILTIFVWVCYCRSLGTYAAVIFLCFGIPTTIFLIIFTCMIIYLRSRIQLFIVLLRESSKAIFAMPLLLAIPIVGGLIGVIILAMLLTTSLYIFPGNTSGVTIFTYTLNIIVAIWAYEIVVGIMCMTVAGAVSKWYFAKNKDFIEKPIFSSLHIAVRYHLGTAVVGSVVITVTSIIRKIIRRLIENRSLFCYISIILKPVDNFLKIFSKNAYILTAMHGKSFFASGQRAVEIMYKNSLKIITINYIGDFILFMASCATILLCMLVSSLIIFVGGDIIFFHWELLIISCVTTVIASTIYSLYKTIIDTIFMCFCEDSLLNDGISRPYAMSRDLMEFVDNCKKVYGERRK